MEPPPKRRRHGKSPLDSTDTEDDELGFEPHEVLARRDPAYKLSLDRAYADNRFQSTMAHIFEKYGRDFEGIGDEIDMMTGEIVVNNGHLQNMRSETDVGLRNGNEEAEEDEGILLDELTDDEPDGLLMGPGQCHKAGQEAAEQEAEQEDEDDRILHGHAPSRTSTSLVAFRRPQAPPILPPTTIAPGLLGTRHLPFTPPFSFGGSPLALGISPLDMRSLGLFGSHMAPLEPPDIFPGPSRLLPTPGERYDFLERNGGSSIWAPSYQFKDNEPDGAIQPLRQPPARRTRRMKYIAPSASKGLNEDVDDDIILAGKNFGHDQGSSLSETHERLKDELLITGDAPSSEPSRKPRKRGRPVTRTKSVSHTPQQQQHEKAATQTKKGSTELLSERSTSNGNIPITSREHVEFVADDQGDSTAKQPRHAEQQARFPDKRPRNHAHGGRRRQYKLEVQIPAVDPSRLAEYMAIEDAVKFVADSADEASNNSVSPETEEIPEPQDASTKVNSARNAPPRKPTAKPSSPICPTPSRPLCTPSKPQTPGHRCIPITRAPSSRRSILSLLSPDPALPVDGADEERDLDELVGLTDVLSTSFLSDSAAPWSSKIWKSSALTTEIYHTPVKKRPTDAVSPGSVIRTPGGTIRSPTSG
ncbi:hypothetical protein RJ55_07171 [Drechmeria coniospora]|nr:hypothetical protein RJ55_07171 [Drechmeria coniospora]